MTCDENKKSKSWIEWWSSSEWCQPWNLYVYQFSLYYCFTYYFYLHTVRRIIFLPTLNRKDYRIRNLYFVLFNLQKNSMTHSRRHTSKWHKLSPNASSLLVMLGNFHVIMTCVAHYTLLVLKAFHFGGVQHQCAYISYSIKMWLLMPRKV